MLSPVSDLSLDVRHSKPSHPWVGTAPSNDLTYVAVSPSALQQVPAAWPGVVLGLSGRFHVLALGSAVPSRCVFCVPCAYRLARALHPPENGGLGGIGSPEGLGDSVVHRAQAESHIGEASLLSAHRLDGGHSQMELHGW